MVEITEAEDRLICTFSGRMDTARCMEDADVVTGRISQAGKTVVFDLAGVDYVASMFLRVCIQAAKQVGAERFSLVNVCPPVKKVFKMAGLDKHIALS